MYWCNEHFGIGMETKSKQDMFVKREHVPVEGQGHRSFFFFFFYDWEALVTRNLHVKYEGSIWNG